MNLQIDVRIANVSLEYPIVFAMSKITFLLTLETKRIYFVELVTYRV